MLWIKLFNFWSFRMFQQSTVVLLLIFIVCSIILTRVFPWGAEGFLLFKTGPLAELNPFTAKCGQRQIPTKFPNFIFSNFEKQIASCESTGRELSSEWSHHRISSTDSKVRVTLQNSVKHSGSERVKETQHSVCFNENHVKQIPKAHSSNCLGE